MAYRIGNVLMGISPLVSRFHPRSGRAKKECGTLCYKFNAPGQLDQGRCYERVPPTEYRLGCGVFHIVDRKVPGRCTISVNLDGGNTGVKQVKG